MRIKVKSFTTEDTEITEERLKSFCGLRVLCGEEVLRRHDGKLSS